MRMRNGSSGVLDPAFFARAADIVARDLLGRTLVRRTKGKRIALTITETEAYMGPHDLACHAARGRTPRTEVMYGPPGSLYIYFVYGLHWMLNVVTREEGYPAAVLIRAAGKITGPARLTALSTASLRSRKRACGLRAKMPPPRPSQRPASVSPTPGRGGRRASCASCRLRRPEPPFCS
jgi:DNA-3-methyladenine glycosylase